MCAPARSFLLSPALLRCDARGATASSPKNNLRGTLKIILDQHYSFDKIKEQRADLEALMEKKKSREGTLELDPGKRFVSLQHVFPSGDFSGVSVAELPSRGTSHPARH